MEPVFKLTNAESKLADLLWIHGPIPSMELVKLALEEYGWKKSTTFSVLKVLIEKGVARNELSVVSMLYTRDQFVTGQSRVFVEDMFGGSLPQFITSFFGGKRLTFQQAEELRKLIDDSECEDGERIG